MGDFFSVLVSLCTEGKILRDKFHFSIRLLISTSNKATASLFHGKFTS